MPIDFGNYFKELRKRREPTETFWNRKPPMPDFDSEENQGWLQGVLGRLRERFEEKKATLGRVGEYAGALGKAALPQEYGTRSDLLDILGRVQKVPVPEGTELPANIFTALKDLEAWEGRRAAEGITRYREAGGIGEAPIFPYKGSETWEQRLAKSQEKEKRAKEFEESTFAPKGTTGEYVERLAQGALDIAQFVPGGGIIPGLARKAGLAGTKRIILLRKGLARLENDLVTGARPKAVVNKQIASVKAELARLEVAEVPAVPSVAEGAKAAPVTPEVTKPDITPTMPESYVQAKKRPDGKWQLFFTGTRNEVFPNELFASASEAKMAFRVAKTKAPEVAIPKAGMPEAVAPAKPEAPKAEVPPVPPEKPPAAMGAPEIPPEAPKPRGKPTPVEPLAAATEGMDLPNQLRVTHREVLADVDTVRQSLIGKTDTNSRLARMILKDTERQLSKANQTLKQMETGQQVSDETITALKDRIVKNRLLYQASTQGKKELKATLVDYIKVALPPTERGKLLASVKNVTTEKGLGKAIDRVNQIAELGEQKGLVSDIYKELSKTKPTKTVTGVLQGKLTPEAQKQLDDIRGMVNTSRAEAQQQIIKNVEAYNNGTMAYDDMIIQNERLRYAGVKEMNAGELQNILEEIQDIRSGARSSRIAEAIADKQRIQDIKDQVKNVVTGGEGLKPGTVSLPPEQLKPKVTWREKITNWQYGWSSLLDKLSKLHKISGPFQSPLSKFGEVVDTARSAQYAGENTALASIHEMLNQVFKPKNRSELNRLLNTQRNEKVALGKFTNAVGESFDLNLTKGEMMSLYNQLKDATLDSTFRNGMKWTDEMMDAVRNGLSAQEKAYADGAMEFFNRYYDSINEVYRKVYHMDLPRRDTYFPAFRERDTDIPELIRLMEEANRYNSVAAKSLIARVENIRPLKFLDINDVLMNHITQMEHFKAWAEPMRDIRRVFNDREVRTAIKQYHGDDILKTLEGFINDMARDGVDRAKVNRTVDMLRKNFTLAVLGVKPFIGVKQLPAVFAYAGGMPVKDFTKGVLGFWRNPIRNYRTLVNKSAYFKNRFGEGFERDIKFALEKGTARRLSNTANFKDYLMTLIRYGDRMAAAPGGWAEYQRVLRTGASEVKALHSAEVVAKRLQATSELETLSAIQRAGSWGKLFTMFQTEPNKYFRLVADNVRNIQYGRGSRASAIKNLIVGWVVLPSVFQWITDGFEVEPTHQARAVVLGPLNNLLVIGGMLQSIEGWLTDQPYDYQASPVFASMDDLRNAVTKTAKMIQAGFDPTKDVSIDDVIKSIEYYAKFAGEVTGVPTPYAIQVERALREGKPAGLIFPASITKEKESLVIAGLRKEWGEDIGKYFRIPSDPLEIRAKKLTSREDTRRKDPDLDAKLFVTGQTTSVLTPEAGRIVMQIIQEKKIDPETIPGVKRNKELLARQEELGLPNVRVTQTEALTTGLTGGAYMPPSRATRRITGLSGRRITRTTMPSPLAGRRARRLAVRKTRRTTMPSPLRR